MANILYLEDEAWQVQGTVITFLEVEFHHIVELVHSLEEAEEKLSTTAYDVVFLDIMMNRKRGITRFEESGLLIAQKILANAFESSGNRSTTPIVIASGVWDATVEDEKGNQWVAENLAREMGIPETHWLRKPFLADEAQEILNLVLPGEANDANTDL